MQKLISICAGIVLLNGGGSLAFAAPAGVAISGEVIFSCDYKVDLMQAAGVRFSGPGTFGKFKTNFFGVPEAEVVIKSGKGEIIGLAKAKGDGRFLAQVPKADFYQLSVDYHGKKIDQVIPFAEAIKPQQMSLGRFEPGQGPCKID